MNIESILLAAQHKATQMGIAITISIVDSAGHLVAMRRMAGCSYFGIEASRQKAVSSSQLKAPTRVLLELGDKLPVIQQAFNKNNDVLTLPGGFPLIEDGAVVGGLGVSGGDFVQDRAIGEAAQAANSN